MATPELVYVVAVGDAQPNSQDVLMQSITFKKKGQPFLFSARVFELDLYKPKTVVGFSMVLNKAKDKEYTVLHPTMSAKDALVADAAIDGFATNLAKLSI